MIAELDGQPVEQLGMRRPGAVAAEVVGRLDDSAAEMIVPEAIGDRTPGEHVLGAGEPVGQGGATAPLVLGMGQRKRAGQTGKARERSRADRFAGLLDLAPAQHGDRAWGVGLDAINQRSLR